jgi:hypothetical protein
MDHLTRHLIRNQLCPMANIFDQDVDVGSYAQDRVDTRISSRAHASSPIKNVAWGALRFALPTTPAPGGQLVTCRWIDI